MVREDRERRGESGHTATLVLLTGTFQAASRSLFAPACEESRGARGRPHGTLEGHGPVMVLRSRSARIPLCSPLGCIVSYE